MDISNDTQKGVRFSNDVPYQNQVEYVGWKNTPPYRPYAKTSLYLEGEIAIIESKFSQKNIII
jgi:hypothetical protein